MRKEGKSQKTSETKTASDSTQRMAQIMGVEFHYKNRWVGASPQKSSDLKRLQA